MEDRKIIENCVLNLGRGRAIATGIGVFAAVSYHRGRNILLRKREERNSLFNEDLSQKWELPGGGVEIQDFVTGDYTSAVFNCLKRELMEEAGLELVKLPSPLLMIPAWLSKEYVIDLAFVVPLYIGEGHVKETAEYQKLSKEGKLKFSPKSMEKISIISLRMNFLIQQAFAFQ
jgi:8-oxo-dGTP pyrophosphatase MutT (NUDIX family)